MEQQPLKAELTGRQRARMADLSLLLDIILKTQAASAKQAICKNGILHQLQVEHLLGIPPDLLAQMDTVLLYAGDNEGSLDGARILKRSGCRLCTPGALARSTASY